jgi:hypothetical protein
VGSWQARILQYLLDNNVSPNEGYNSYSDSLDHACKLHRTDAVRVLRNAASVPKLAKQRAQTVACFEQLLGVERRTSLLSSFLLDGDQVDNTTGTPYKTARTCKCRLQSAPLRRGQSRICR